MSKRRRNSVAGTTPGRVKVKDVFVARPFAGLADEPEWVALREFISAASAPLRLATDLAERYGDPQVTLATVLPLAAPAIVKPDRSVLLGLQRQVHSGDVSRDLAAALLSALDTEPGGTVAVPALPGAGPRLQDVLADGSLEISLHENFGFWLDADAADDPDVAASLERANAAITPVTRLAAARAAYFFPQADRAWLRWVLPDEENAVLAALARLSAAGEIQLTERTRFAGMFRAHGRLVPVWDLPGTSAAGDWEEPVAEFAKRYADALADGTPLDAAGRRARHGLLGRQLTLR